MLSGNNKLGDSNMDEKFKEILNAFKKNGGRVTEQRKQLLSVILKNPGCTCKELYYLARKYDNGIGRATVYRTIKSLEDMGYISKRAVAII